MNFRYLLILIVGMFLGGITMELLQRNNILTHVIVDEKSKNIIANSAKRNKFSGNEARPNIVECNTPSLSINNNDIFKPQQSSAPSNKSKRQTDRKYLADTNNIDALTTEYEIRISEISSNFIELAESSNLDEDIDSIAYAIEKVMELDQDRDQKFSSGFVTKVIDAISYRSDIPDDTRHILITGLIGSADASHIEPLVDIANYYTDDSNRANLLAISEALLQIDSEVDKHQLNEALEKMKANPVMPEITKSRITAYLAEIN
jgi:hypothetical protein